jgi:sugar phosphate permease
VLPDQLPEDQRRRLHGWRIKVFAATWLSYVGLYFCRKPFYMAKPIFTEKLGLGAVSLGEIGLGYLSAYTAGQFISGAIGTFTGARLMLLVGMAASVACNVILGAAAGYWVLMVFMVFNGLAQATGWSGNVGTMANWTSRQERGTVMGLWATCYLVGGILANTSATLLMNWRSWSWGFYGGAAVLTVITAVFAMLHRNRPQDVGLPALSDARADGDAVTPAQEDGRLGWDAQVIVTLLLVGGFYFCIKFIRYALWSWAAYFLRLNFGLDRLQYGFAATAFDFAGFFGVIFAGVISDRFFRGRRSMIAFLMLVGMIGGCVLLWRLGSHSVLVFTVGLGIVGFMLYGPDSILSGAGAIDLGGKRGAILAAGVINGIGSIGAMVQEVLVGRMYQASGGDLEPIFLLLLGAAVLALVFVGIVLLRNRAGQSDL